MASPADRHSRNAVVTMRVAAVQMSCGPDCDENFRRAGDLVGSAAADGAELVVLPELFASLDRNSVMRTKGEPVDGPTCSWAAGIARSHSIWLVAGSFIERDGDRLFNTSCLFDPNGKLRATYRKIHLFDIEFGDTISRESDTFSPGEHPATATLHDAVVGMTICYDLRFPELFRVETLLGATIITVPSAFTAATGPDHWEVLLRARAIENQVAIVAAAQWGTGPDGTQRHGHALIVDAWGRVLADAGGKGDTVIAVDIDLDEIRAIRARVPSLANRRPEAYRWPEGNPGV
jgi:predicted amidohydrolase